MKRTALLIAAVTLSACGFFSDADDRPLAQGYTPCNDLPRATDGVICHPNQYCASQKLNWCHTGCLSDDNCSHEQICTKNSDANVGRCTAVSALPEEEPELRPGYTACGDSNSPGEYEICQPSQHCSDYDWGICAAGCLSEENCTEQQTCQKAQGENVGTCQAVDP